MSYTNYTPQEVESKGEAIYVRQIRDKLNPKRQGEFLVINIETGEYEVNADDLVATKRLLANCPNAVIYGLRIGFPTAYRIGSGFSVKAESLPDGSHPTGKPSLNWKL